MCCMLYVICCMLYAICYMLYAIGYVLYVVCYMLKLLSFYAIPMIYVICYMLYVICYMLYVIVFFILISYAIRHMPYSISILLSFNHNLLYSSITVCRACSIPPVSVFLYQYPTLLLSFNANLLLYFCLLILISFSIPLLLSYSIPLSLYPCLCRACLIPPSHTISPSRTPFTKSRRWRDCVC
jgi:hypothetical protein